MHTLVVKMVMVKMVKIDFGNAVFCSLYINRYLYYSGGFDSIRFRF